MIGQHTVCCTLARSVGGWADDFRVRSNAFQVCKYLLDRRPPCRLCNPTSFHQFPSSISKPNIFCVSRFCRSYSSNHMVHKLILMPLSLMKWLESSKYFVYHHPQSIDIRRLCGPGIPSTENCRGQQFWSHEDECTASCDRSHLSLRARSEGRKSEVCQTSSRRRFVVNQDVLLQIL